MKPLITAARMLTALLLILSLTAGCAKQDESGNTSAAAVTTEAATATAKPTATAAPATTAPLPPVSDNRVWYHKDVLNILLIGYDYGSKNQEYARSDSMIIFSLNKRNKSISLVSLSRAAYVSIPGHSKNRLNAAHAYGGPELLAKTVELNYKVRIDHYISVGFEGFTNIIDALGGIDVSLSTAELGYLHKNHGMNTARGAGTYHLDGELTLAYSRMRSIDNDKARTGRQRNVLTKLAGKGKTLPPARITALAGEFFSLVHTDITKAELAALAAESLLYAHYPITRAMIPEAAPLVKVNGYEVLMLNWEKERHRLHSLLYAGMDPQ